MPHFIEFDHQGPPLGLRLLRVRFGELLDPGHHAGRRHPEQLGGAVHRQPAQVQEHGRDLDPQRHAARRGVGEVQPARPAAVALLAPHQAVLDVLPAPAPLAPQPHRPTPPAVPPPTDIGNLRRPKTLVIRNGNLWEKLYINVFAWDTKSDENTSHIWKIKLIFEGFTASGLGQYPPDTSFRQSMEPESF